MLHIRRFAFLAVVFASGGSAGWVGAQELTPRAYWPAPDGTNVFVTAYQFSSGEIVTDPSLPVVGVESKINFAQVAWQRTFNLFGRTASTQFSMPYSWGDSEGFVNGEFLQRRTVGYGDFRARLAINLSGAPTMNVAQFQELRTNPRPIVGVSLLVQAPTGSYHDDRILNVGSNRWAVKPAVGVILPFNKTWMFEFEVGTWLFSDNDNFVGRTREQEPLLSTEFHLIKLLRAGLWASFDMNFYVGGRTIVDSTRRADFQRNSRIGATVLYPWKRHHALRGSFSRGIVTETGSDYSIFNISYMYAW